MMLGFVPESNPRNLCCTVVGRASVPAVQRPARGWRDCCSPPASLKAQNAQRIIFFICCWNA